MWGEGVAPHMANRRPRSPRKCGGKNVPTGEEAAPHSWPSWGQRAAAGSLGRRGRHPSPPIFFLFPKAILRRRGGVRTGAGWADRICLVFSISPYVVFACFPRSLPWGPPNGKVTFPEKGRAP